MKLVIVETPAQAKVLTDALGHGWRVEPCYGMLRDFPAKTLGVETSSGFRPTFTVLRGKGGIVIRLKKALRDAEAIYAATPPGHDGELMAWHVPALVPDLKPKPVYRVRLDALTPDSIRAGFTAPRPLDMHRVDAALTAGIADRLAGFTINAAASLALEIRSGLTYAGMVALRLLFEREARVARNAYWQSSVRFAMDDRAFTAKVLNAKGQPLTLRTEAQARQLARMLDHASYWVEKVGGTTRAHPAPAPLTLATLIEIASRELGISPQRVLSLVSILYDAGWIAHPDGKALPESTFAAQTYIQREFGDAYLAGGSPVPGGIVPTDVDRLPEDLPGEGAALYRLIWRYFVAAHMTPAQERLTAARIRVGPARGKPYPVTLLAQSGQIAFDGWMRVFKDRTPDEAAQRPLLLKEGLAIEASDAEVVQEQRHAFEYFSETTLVVALAQIGLSVQSAVDAVAHLQSAGAVTVTDGAVRLTDDGRLLGAYLNETFSELTSPAQAKDFFADVETVASGHKTRTDVLAAFWSRFTAAESPAEPTDEGLKDVPVTPHAQEEV